MFLTQRPMNLASLQSDPAAFRDALRIDADAGPVAFGKALDPWQREDFEAIDPALRHVVGQDVEAKQRIYLERPRGHSKTTDIAAAASWLLFASRRKINGVACAADKDQAALIRDACDTLVRQNPWLAQIIEVQGAKVINKHTGSVLTILSSDAASSYGVLIDFAIVDELTHWLRRDLWDSIFSAAAKRRHCLLLVISNAGFRESWQWELREAIRTDPAWTFRRLDGPVASWITPERLEEQRRLLPAKVFARLWLNQWADGAGDAFEAADVDAAVTLSGPTGCEQGWSYLAGLDIGLRRDSSALVVLGKHVGHSKRTVRQPKKLAGPLAALADLDFFDAPQPEVTYQHVGGTGRLRVAAVRLWNPQAGRVELDEIERAILRLHEIFKLQRLAFDPWQAEHLGQRLAKRGLRCDPVQFTPQSLQSMATATLDAFRERQIELFPHTELVADLKAMRVVEKSYGFRLAPGSAPEGTRHGDAATALAIALHSIKDIRAELLWSSERKLIYN
jgi:phage terminase large subunit-like protein